MGTKWKYEHTKWQGAWKGVQDNKRQTEKIEVFNFNASLEV